MLPDEPQPVGYGGEALLLVFVPPVVAHHLAQQAQLRPPVAQGGGLRPARLQKGAGLSLPAAVVQGVQLPDEPGHVQPLPGGLGVRRSGIGTGVKGTNGVKMLHDVLLRLKVDKKCI